MMRAKLQEYAITAERGNKVQMAVAIVSDGAVDAIPVGGTISLSNSTVVSSAAIGSLVGTLSVVGGSGTYIYSLTSNPGGLFAIVGSALNVAASLSAGSKPITISASNGVDPAILNTFTVTVTAAVVAPSGSVSITGSTVVLSTLTAVTGTWAGTAPITFAYQWKRAGTNVGTNSSTYATVAADIGSTMTVVVTGTNAGGSGNATSAATAAITGIVPANAGGANLPAISGSTVVGGVLTTTNGTWTGTPAPTFTRQWKSAGVNVGTGLTTYTTVPGDVGNTITVVVTATNVAGSANATSAATGVITASSTLPANSGGANLPTISGSTAQGATLTATSGIWTGSPAPTYAYQWKRGATNVGTNSINYTTLVGDVGSTITVVVTATNVAGSANATSAAFGPIVAGGPSAGLMAFNTVSGSKYVTLLEDI
jgi:hypothetical protein